MNVVDRIQKLLRLSESGNPNEAANAMAMAQRLMERHRISRAEVESEDDDSVVDEIEVAEGRRFATWRQVLLSCIAESNGCACYRRQFPDRSVMVVIGTEEDREVCAVMYRWISHQIDAMALEYPGTRIHKHSFRRGATATVTERIRLAKAEARAGTSTTALAKIDNTEAIQAWVDENLGKPRPASPDRYRPHADAFRDGVVAGHRVDLRAQKALEDDGGS